MKVVISGGGTGGHIYPAITIAKEIVRLAEGCEFLFVGTKDGLEAGIVPKEGFNFKTINVRGLERRLTLKNLKTLFLAAVSVRQSLKILRAFRPDVVVGTGGFVCGPVLLAAWFLKIPALIQEQNAVPGVTNKILARFATKIAVGYQEAAEHFAGQREKVIVTGNPIRREILEAVKEKAFEPLELQANKITILVAGGSRGARSINQAMLDIYKTGYFVEKSNVQVLHLTGEKEYNNIVGNIKQFCIDDSYIGNIIIKPYLHNMPEALAAADLAVFRAGAVGLAELMARGVPAILIPYPYAAENHQEFNARALEKQGAAIVMMDSELNGIKLTKTLDELINNPEKLKKMSRKCKNLSCPQAAETIAKIVVSLRCG